METRVCNMCKQELPLTSEFFSSKVVKGINKMQYTCRDCRSVYIKKHYRENKDTYLLKALESRDRKRDWFNKIKSTLHCEQCGENRPWVLDFHHKDGHKEGRERSIALMINNCSKEDILEEIKKCMVLCANCHRDVHHTQMVY